MFSKIRWRLIVSFVLPLIMLIIWLSISLTRPICLANAGCIRQRLLIAAGLLLLVQLLAAYYVTERTARPVRQLTQVIQRIGAGDQNARLLPQTKDEVGDMIRAFNRMMEKTNGRLTALTEEHNQLSMAITYMADGVIITDDGSYVQLLNPAAARLLKISGKEALGRTFAEVARHHQLIDLWHRCEADGSEQTEAVEIGRDLFLQTIVTQFQQHGAKGYLVVIQDLTPVRRLQTIRRDFISNISHELRTPLASLRAISETLQDGALEEPQVARRFLGRADRELDVMTQMVEELLELSRIESGQVPLRLQPTAVSQLLLLPVERLKNQAARVGVELIVDLPAGLPTVLADPGRIHQVVSNLIHNAIKFTPEGGNIKLSAFVKPNRFANMVVMTVKDNGVGIPPEDIPRIFERFYKSDRARTRSAGGTGLGLSICRHIVQAHNGRIWVKSKLKRGSTFYFTLPQVTSSTQMAELMAANSGSN